MAQLTIVIRKTHRKGGKKGRKIGRKGRRPCHTRYNEEKRWRKNKAKRILKNNGEAALENYCDRVSVSRKTLGV